MNINLTAKPITMPENMTLKARLQWKYLGINEGGWIAVECGDESIVVTDESGDLFNGFACPDVAAFIECLDLAAEDALNSDPFVVKQFLSNSGAVMEDLLSDDVMNAVLAVIQGKDEESCMTKQEVNT